MPTLEQFLDALRAELGYYECSDRSCPDPARETNRNHTKFAAEAGHANGQPWCQTALVAVAKRTGLVLPNYSARTLYLADAFRKANRWSTKPHVGEFVFWAWNGGGFAGINHVGVVERVRADGTFDTIEANTSTRNQRDGGYFMRRRRSMSSVIGFGLPDYLAPVAPAPAGVPRVSTSGQAMEIDMPLIPHYESGPTDNQGRANITVPVPIERVVGQPICHSEVRPNVDGHYDPVPNSCTATPDELDGGPATTFVIQGDDPDAVFHLWWTEVAA